MWYKKQNLDGLKKYIEHDKNTMRAFLRGLYDAEGHNNGCRLIFLSNNNIKLLQYAQYLLKKYFGITTTGPYLNTRAGSIARWNGKKVKRNHNNYEIQIGRREHVQRFLNEVGFSITRKQLGLKKRDLAKRGFFIPPFSNNQ